jgi:hypothetical protein
MEILKQFEKLLQDLDELEDGLLCIPLDTSSIFRLAVDRDLNPTLLISEEMLKSSERGKTNFKLDKLELDFNVICDIVDVESKKKITAPFTIIKQVNGNPRMHDYFLRVIEGMIFELLNDLSISRLSQELDYLVKLFSSTKSVDESIILGLWGELVSILYSKNMDSCIEAWHLDKDNLFDFSFYDHNVEVKTTTKNTRVHEFNNKQIKNYKRLVVNVTSIMTEKVSLGKSILDLWDEINRKCTNNELKAKVARVISEVVTKDLNALSQVKYNINMAESTIKTINSNLIPHIDEGCIDSGVEEVRLLVNLDKIIS